MASIVPTIRLERSPPTLLLLLGAVPFRPESSRIFISRRYGRPTQCRGSQAVQPTYLKESAMSRRLLMAIVFVLAGVFVSAPLWAAQLSRPQVEYSADSVVQNEEGTTEQHVYVTPAKERRETLTSKIGRAHV